MLIGIVSDTHDEFERTERVVEQIEIAGAQAILHCGDLISGRIVEIGARLPFYFAFGNHDADMGRILQDAANRLDATCLQWGGEIELHHRRIAVAHGHLTSDLRPLLESSPDFLLTGHFHSPKDWVVGTTRRICPGALHRADRYTFALLDLETDKLQILEVD